MIARIYIDGKHRPRAHRYLDAMRRSARHAGVNASTITHYEPFAGLLVSYGSGRPDLTAMLARHVASGQRAINVDAGYWGYAYRLAMDGLHPECMPDAPAARFDAQGITLTDDYDPRGPIILVGLGPKSRHVGVGWEAHALKRIRDAWPGRRVIFRPKPRRSFDPLPIETDETTPIDCLLRGASLVVTRHSNVGVDACFQGIPVCTEAGAAALLYSNDLTRPLRPSEAERRDFLRRLAWWNWTDEEASTPAIWHWLKHALSATHFRTGLSSMQSAVG